MKYSPVTHPDEPHMTKVIEWVGGRKLSSAQREMVAMMLSGHHIKYDRVRGLHMVKDETTEGGNPQDQQ